VKLLPESAQYLVKNDKQAATTIAKNNQYGKAKGWWD